MQHCLVYAFIYDAVYSSDTLPTGLVSVAKFNFQSVGPTGTSALAIDSSSAQVVDANLLILVTPLSTVDGSVTILAPLTCAVTPANAAICAGSSQIFVATPTGGLAPYTYNWSGGPSTQSNTVSSTGTYTCTIHDSNSSSAQGGGHLTVNSLPTQYSVTGGGAYCAGGSGVAVGLSSSQSGVNYQLYTNSTYAVGSAVAGTGSALSFGSQIGAGTYTAIASNTTSGCTQPMSGSQTVTVAALPTQYSVTGGGAYCVGGSGMAVGLSGSQSGVNYQLYTNSTYAVGSAVAGTGSALSFGNQTGAGTYTATASNITSGCTQPMSGSQTVTVNPPSVGGTATPLASPICSGSGTTITLTGYTGSIQWQSSTDNVTFNDVGGQTSVTLTTGALGVTTHYRARVTSGACSAATSTVAHVTINQTPAAPTAGNSNNGLVCLGSTLNLTASTVSGATYNWSGPNSFSSTQQNPSISNVTLAASGTYSVTATVSNCPSVAGSTVVTVNPTAVGGTATPTASSLCSGSGTTITLSGYTGAIQWQSSTDNVTFNNVSSQTAATLTTGALGVTTHYRARVTSGACSAATSTVAHVTINLIPATPAAGNNGPVCLGSTLSLTASAVSGATYSWSGPHGFSSTQQNPSISNATLTNSGTYYVTATISNCTSVAGSTVVTVNPTPVGGTATPTASSLCSGSGTTIKLTNYVGTIQWQSSTNNVLFSDVSDQTAATLNTGALSVTTYFRARVTSGVCSATNSTVATVTITGIVVPSVTTIADVGTNICAGTLVTFTATPVNGGTPTYVWKKNGSVVGGSNNTYSDAALANGDYIDCQLTSSFSCASPSTANAATIVMTVNPVPAAPTVGNNGPLCVGATLNLTASTVGDATYSWTGPNGFTSTEQNPTITNVTTAASGLYSVIATASSCISSAGTTTVTVDPAAVGGTATPVDSAVCNASGTTIALAGQTGAIVKWQSSTNNATWLDLASTNNPYATGNLVATTYFRAVIQSGVCSLTNSTTAQVTVSGVVTPAVTVAADPGNTICAGTAVTFTATPVNGGSMPIYVWKKNGSVVGGSGPTYPDSGLANGDYIDCQLTSSSSCASSSTANAPELTMIVHAVPATPTAGNNGPFCLGTTLSLTASNVDGATYSWTGPNGFSSALQNPSISNATAAAAGTYHVTAIITGCASPAGSTIATLVVDTIAPQIQTCALSMTNAVDHTGQVAVPDFTGAVHATDNCTPTAQLVITQVPVAGTWVGLGTVPVTITVKDASGNPATCESSFTAVNVASPIITVAPSVTNAFMIVDGLTVLVAGDTNVFSVTATDPSALSLGYEWQFGDGTTSDVSALPTALHVYGGSNCGPYTASVTVSNGSATVSSNLQVAVACGMTVTKEQVGADFKKGTNDSVMLTATIAGLPGTFNPSNQVVTVDIGNAERSFTLNKAGVSAGKKDPSTCRLKYTKPIKTKTGVIKKAGYWTLTVTMKNGLWHAGWLQYGIRNATIKAKPVVLVTVPIVVLVDGETFASDRVLKYIATTNKTGTATLYIAK